MGLPDPFLLSTDKTGSLRSNSRFVWSLPGKFGLVGSSSFHCQRKYVITSAVRLSLFFCQCIQCRLHFWSIVGWSSSVGLRIFKPCVKLGKSLSVVKCLL